MRVILAHNFYRSTAPSGEDAVYREERALLEESGFEVVPYERRSDDLDSVGVLGLASAALDAAWSKRTYREMMELLRQVRPQLVHFHNTFPLISPSAYEACWRLGVPVVQTLHNFRLVCPGALMFRDGGPCDACVGASLRHALRHRCYRGSFLATSSVVRMLHLNRRAGVYASRVDRYIALTSFARDQFIAGGLPAERIVVKQNGLSSPPEHSGAGDGGYIAYAGRLSEEKGVCVLLEAIARLRDARLHVYGDGPLRAQLEAFCSERRLPVTFFGQVPRDELQVALGGAALLVAPSLWFEGLPMVIVEAFACGTPVVASDIGSLAEMIDDGVTGRLFAPGDSHQLARILDESLRSRSALAAMRMACRRVFDAKFSPAANRGRLVSIYDEAIAQRRAANAEVSNDFG